jgi:hypothetical protein
MEVAMTIQERREAYQEKIDYIVFGILVDYVKDYRTARKIARAFLKEMSVLI